MGDQSLIHQQHDSIYIGAVRFVSLSSCGTLQPSSNFFDARKALSSFSTMIPLLFERRRYTAGSRRAGLRRPNPVCTRRAIKTVTTRCVHEEEEEQEEEEEVCRQFASFKRRKEEERKMMKTKTNKERRTLTISHSSSETTTASPLDDDSDDDVWERGAEDVEGMGKEEEEAKLCCCTPVTRTPSTMRTGKDMLGTRAKSTRDEEDTILDTHTPEATLRDPGDVKHKRVDDDDGVFFVGEYTAL